MPIYYDAYKIRISKMYDTRAKEMGKGKQINCYKVPTLHVKIYNII